MVVSEVEPESRAAKIGIQPDDTLVHIGYSGDVTPIRVLDLVSIHS